MNGGGGHQRSREILDVSIAVLIRKIVVWESLSEGEDAAADLFAGAKDDRAHLS